MFQTDRRTDGQTTCLGNTALRVASRGKNAIRPSLVLTVLTFLEDDVLHKCVAACAIYYRTQN